MDEDLTASHWDDVLPTTQPTLGVSKLGLIFDSLDLDDPHRDPAQHAPSFGPTTNNESEQDEAEEAEESEENQYTASNAFGFDSPFQATGARQAEEDQLSAIKQQQRDSLKSSLLQELAGAEENSQEPAANSVKFSASESLFEDRGSPLKVQALETPADALASSVVSPLRTNLRKTGQFKAARGRRIPAKSVAKHLAEASGGLDPLSSLAVAQNPSTDPAPAPSDKSQTLLRAVDLPLYEIAKSTGTDSAREEELAQNLASLPQEGVSEPEPPKAANDLEISLGDPVKVGDITTAHIVYGIRTTNKNPQLPCFPQTAEAVLVSRRYKDFRWIYHQLQSNHPGRIIPPPPSKQTYIGRFNENFVENRRQSLEKMLVKISKTPGLADDGDFVLFLTSQNFASDSREREQASGSGASVQASSGDDDGDRASGAGSIVSGTGAGGFMSSLFSIATKLPEPDDFFLKKKGYIEDLEHNLKTFYKLLELIASQRLEISAVVGEIAAVVEELAELEILKPTSQLLGAFAEVQAKLKENLDRVNLQDQLTLGFTIEEYLRIIGSVKHTFETRSKTYQLYQSFKQDLAKKQESLDRLHSRYKSSVDKISQVAFEVDKLQQKVAHYEASFSAISDTIKRELETFEVEKIKDFRNSVEIFIESSIESQKEAIELWETFYERNKLVLV